MFLGAMIIAPAAAYVLKLCDKALEDRVPSGFEMLIDNFSIGILGGAFACVRLRRDRPGRRGHHQGRR